MVLGFLLTVLVIILYIIVINFAINTGNEWRTEEPLKEEVTGL